MSITVAEAKKKADRVRERLTQLNAPVSHAQALEVVATVFGDANWAAMRARLTPARKPKAKTPKLSVYNCAMYAETENGERHFMEKATILAFSAKEAEAYLDEHYFPSQYASSGYATAVFNTEVLCDFGNDTFPELDALCNWLAEWLSQSISSPVASSTEEAFVQLMSSVSVKLEWSDIEADAIRAALEAAAPRFKDAQALMSGLYRILPEHVRYAAGEHDFSSTTEDTLRFSAT